MLSYSYPILPSFTFKNKTPSLRASAKRASEAIQRRVNGGVFAPLFVFAGLLRWRAARWLAMTVHVDYGNRLQHPVKT